MTTPLPWSHSSIEQFHTCPRKYEELKVLRNFQDEKNPASLWGDEVHKAFEKWIRHVVELKPLVGVEGAIADAELHNVLPVSMQQYVPYLRQFVIRPGTTLAEQQYAITRELKPCEIQHGWRRPNNCPRGETAPDNSRLRLWWSHASRRLRHL